MTRGDWAVYQIRFSDAVYVGVTTRSVDALINRHIKRPVNGQLSQWLKCRKYRVEILRDKLTAVEALAIEADAKAAATAPVLPRKTDAKISTDPVPGKYRCRSCKTIKAHTEFWRNRRLTNGLTRKCRDCCNAAKRARYAASAAKRARHKQQCAKWRKHNKQHIREYDKLRTSRLARNAKSQKKTPGLAGCSSRALVRESTRSKQRVKAASRLN